MPQDRWNMSNDAVMGWRAGARRLGMGLSALGALSCSHHVKLAVPGTTGSSLYICEKGGCRPSEVDSAALLNQSGTTFIILPKECHGRFNELTVLDAGSDSPRVFARCAPSENPLGEMAARGAWQPVSERRAEAREKASRR